MYESSGDGFYIAGIKGGFYDPDFIKYDDIEEITMEHKNIRLLAKDGKRITLINMGRKINIIYHDMIDKLEKNEVRPDCT
jgi:hypothetical protein